MWTVAPSIHALMLMTNHRLIVSGFSNGIDAVRNLPRYSGSQTLIHLNVSIVSKQTDKFYNRFSILYPLVDIFLKPQKRRLFQEINNLPSGRLLEIGVGNGNHMRLYQYHEVTGIDTSLKMLELAAKQSTQHFKLLHMSGEQLMFQNQAFDYVVLSHVIAVVDNPEKLLEEIHRVLKPGGKVFILNHFTPDNWLKFIDRSFQMVSQKFHFKSVFYVHSLSAIQKFSLLKEIRFGRLSYFKLLIYGKA
jgi:phosphatidylethanolamine/phosphatidyl-N-methylethanolamine N-methyltransferase